jgi:serine/threonine-protein kinase
MSAPESSPEDPTAHRAPEETPTVVAEGSGGRLLQLTPGTVIGERYRVVSLIGSGGMGQVYRADDLKLGQTVALKFLAGHGDAKRLYEEVKVGRQVSHPNVCRLYDIAEVDGHLFITMEFVDGEDLASLLRRVGRLSAEKALALTRDICAGVAAAHEKGVIHRDLKPANVMIDGRGRARVTDFGLAVAGETATDGAGTPAYMAPEQLAGEPASMRSDIYALGLVIYELFTGRRAFEVTSTYELLARQRRSEFTRPSLVTKDVPAAVERVIARCLDPVPDARPSIEQIGLELPGGDPLAAAIAAGETPSPAMVTAAADRGELSVKAATAWLAAFALLAISYGLLVPRTMQYKRVTVKSPEVLEERVQDVLRMADPNLQRTDSSSTYAIDLQWLARRDSHALPPMLFAYRQSPLPMAARNLEHRIVLNDPPLVYSGMADVTLESDGRLRQYLIVPPQKESGPVSGAEVDWRPFLAMAAAAPPFRPVQPEWATLVDTDRKYAWLTSDGSRIEGASYHGKPVSFFVVKPWAKPWRMAQSPDTPSPISAMAAVVVYALFCVAAAGLVLRNLRRGQGDQRGARRIGAICAIVAFLASLTLMHHVADTWDETIALILTGGLALTCGANAWLGYVAIEPLVRRRWPRMLISESRLVSGLVRDAMVGRDLLVGVVTGFAFTVLRQLPAFLPDGAPLQTSNLTLSGLRYVAWFLGAGAVVAIFGPIVGATVLVGVHTVTRRLAATWVIVVLLGSGILVGDVSGPVWCRVLFGVLGAVTVLILLFRFGLLAYSASAFTYVFVRRMPITLDPSDWFFGRSAFALAIVVALVFYGFVTSLGGKRWLPELKVD